jgi:hypothetical protein
MSADLHARRSTDLASCGRTVQKLKAAADVIATSSANRLIIIIVLARAENPQEKTRMATIIPGTAPD